MGCFGGIINYLLIPRSKLNNFVELIKSVVFGLGAACLVPLFLNTISSTLIIEAESNYSKLLVFSGFCLIASIFSKSFIFSISKKVLKDLEEKQENITRNLENVQESVIQIKDEIQPVIEKESEPYEYSIDEKTVIFVDVNDKELSILKKLAEGTYTYRSMKNLSKELNLPEKTLEYYAGKLTAKRLVNIVFKERSKMIAINNNGRQLINKSID